MKCSEHGREQGNTYLAIPDGHSRKSIDLGIPNRQGHHPILDVDSKMDKGLLIPV